MSPLFSSTPEAGDLIHARRDIATSFTDQITGTSSIHRGTRGLVRARRGNRLTIAFDTGAGITEVTINARDCRLIERNTDERRFTDRAQFKAAIRAGALIALTAPLVWYTVMYWWLTGSLDGLITAMTLSAIESALELPALMLTNPGQTLLWLGAGTLAARMAFGRRPSRKHNR